MCSLQEGKNLNVESIMEARYCIACRKILNEKPDDPKTALDAISAIEKIMDAAKKRVKADPASYVDACVVEAVEYIASQGFDTVYETYRLCDGLESTTGLSEEAKGYMLCILEKIFEM